MRVCVCVCVSLSLSLSLSLKVVSNSVTEVSIYLRWESISIFNCFADSVREGRQW